MIIIIFILGLDQLTKLFINKNLSLNQSIPIFKGIFHLTLIHNRGAAFGLFRNQVILLISVSFFAILLIYFNLRQGSPDKKNSLYKLSLSFILAGALGNLIDRLCFGYVIDFLDLRIWPVFNVADSAITIGAILLGCSLLRESKVKT
jgi:signal peptidase II